MVELIHVQPLIDMVTLSLQTKFIPNEPNGANLLVIAKPETAKTWTLAMHFSNLDFVSYYDEITQKKLIDEFLPLVKVGQKRVLMIPDLINCIQKQKSTREQFLNMIKTGIDDIGVRKISTYHKQLQYAKLVEGLRFSMITATTTANYYQLEKEIKDTGLLSRYTPFAFDLPIDIISDIFKVIEGYPTDAKWKVKVPKIVMEDIAVKDKPHLFQNFEIVATTLGAKYEGFGFRSQAYLQRLAKASSIISGRNEVNKEDIEKIMGLCRWINYDFNSL